MFFLKQYLNLELPFTEVSLHLPVLFAQNICAIMKINKQKERQLRKSFF